jgi:hypothetical protein
MELMKRHWRALLLPGALLGVMLYAALAPVKPGPSRDVLFEIPKGTWARRMAGDMVDILPSRVYLTLGVRDVLLLRNSDSVPQIFGPVLIMPGQDFRLPFTTVSENPFECSAHANRQMTVVVEALPNPGLGRLRWRLRAWSDALRHFEFLPPKRP